MIQSFKKLLNRPFPFIETTKMIFFVSLFFGFFVFGFLSIFQPFGLSEMEPHKNTLIIGYGLITFLILFSSLFLTSKFHSITQIENWTLGNTISNAIVRTFLIGISCWFYKSIISPDISSQAGLFRFPIYSFAIGCIPLAFLFILLERILEQKNQKQAEKISFDFKSVRESSRGESRVCFGPKNQVLDLSLNQLICIRAEGNYVEVFYLKNGALSKELVRHPLSQIFKQLKKNPPIKQCHRSYIVNFDKIEKVSGNARNFNLHLIGVDFPVPVSRSFPSTQIKSIKEYVSISSQQP